MQHGPSHAIVAGAFMIAAVLGACGDDGAGPEGIGRADLTRSYTASTLTTTTAGATIDHLARGASLAITLFENGTTNGRLFVPGGAEDGGDLDVELLGTFTFDDATDQVTFDQLADTFVRDMTFTAVRSGGTVQLEGEETFGGTTVRVVLR